jgi:tetratricopeptide (TPR) repeat protein
MAQVHARYPQDTEAGVFYALSLLGTAQALSADKTYMREKRAAGILNKVLALEPNHPGVAHYLIHAYDSPALANLALAAARAYAKIAPGVPHALHMPSHIFIRLGLWQESINSNLESEAAAKDYARKTKMIGVWDQQLHAMDYLIYAYLQLAQDEKAKGVLDDLNQILKTNDQNLIVAYTFAAVPARYAIERRQWAEAASLELKPQEFAWDRLPWAKAIVYFARGIGSARQGDVAGARNVVAKLEELKSELKGEKGYDWATQVEIQRLAVAAWLAHAERNDQEALSLMRSAADLEDSIDKHPVTPGTIVPARELLADLLIEVGQPAEALKEFEGSLATVPNRFNGLYGAARAAELAGNDKKAKDYYGRLVALCAGECSRRELQQAKAFLAKK